ncbi:MAG: DHH family phosphoesterase [Clostridia bacterium]|nr:DHH family phosphoesterase [Clostridia bacterium]
MPKNSKQKNDLRGFRMETAVVFAVSGLVCVVLFTLGMLLLREVTHTKILFLGLVCLLLHAAASALAYYFFEKRTKNGSLDEALAPVMGRIMFDAVVKMATPVFLCDSSERIIWYNNTTEELHSSKNKLYGESVSELFGVTLAEIRSNRSEEGARLTCDGRSFRAKFNHIKTDDDDYALVITTETTELDALMEKIAGDELVVVYIIIDNLGEMMQYDSELYRPAASQIDEVLRDWADEYGGILKEYERDKYIFITEARILDELILQKFDILDRVRAVRVGDTNLPLTISMGVSNIHGTYEEKERAAHAALDMALQRGGDQAAVKGDSSIDFYGGVTKTVQKRTNVRSRVISNELMSSMKKASNVLIMGHKSADFDAFGACVGLAQIAVHCGTRVNIVTNMADRNLVGCRDLLVSAAEYQNIFVDTADAMDLLETGTLVVVADVNNLKIAELPELAYRTEMLAIIDHHRKTAEFDREPDVEYIEPSASATCEIVAEMLEQVLPNDELSAAEATLMLAGITLDTKHFAKNTGTRTFSAAMYLRDRGADPAVVQDLFRENYSDYIREALFRSNVEIYRDRTAITIVEDKQSSAADRIAASKAAANMLMINGIDASFAMVRIGETTVHISAQSNGKINVQLIMEELGGGGHFDGAGAQVREKSTAEVMAAMKAAIDKHLK